MLTKYVLHINGSEYEMRDDDLRNWDEIACSHKCASYDGVVRSFTSHFEFVNRAYELLREAYLKDGVNARATIDVLTINDRWEYERRFSCPLDFSTLEWEARTMSVNAVDNSLAALIKANKSTKYELAVGADIKADGTFSFDRLPMRESVTYGFTSGTSYDGCADLMVHLSSDGNIWVGKISEEITVGGAVHWQDDQTDEDGGYIMEAKNDMEMTLDFDFSYREDTGSGVISLFMRALRGGKEVTPEITAAEGDGKASEGYLGAMGKGDWIRVAGSFGDYHSLYDRHKPEEHLWAKVGGYIWVSRYTGEPMPDGLHYKWVNTGVTSEADYFGRSVGGKWKIRLMSGDKLFIKAGGGSSAAARVLSSSFVFGWLARGNTADIPAMTPKKVCSEILRRIAGGDVNAYVDISGFDKRIENTYILAAESVRGIPEAKLYTSFGEFCDWMSAVFGYVYRVGETQPSKFLPVIRDCDGYENYPMPFVDEYYTGNAGAEHIVYVAQHDRFLLRDPDTGIYHSRWQGWTDYNHPGHEHARSDTLFRIKALSGAALYRFDDYVSGQTRYPVEHEFPESSFGNPEQTVYFVHRSEALSPDAPVKRIKNSRDLKYTVDTSVIYSAVTAGYDKKDYDSVNGRDEFNFSNTYSTGCTVSDKTLSLLSKYRADCYGIEFAAQKRGKDTTDNSADKDVFFVLCSKDEDGRLVPDRGTTIENCISGQVFNGAFSPMACVMANAGYIGLQAEEITLSFASSTGNSDVVIDGLAVNGDIRIRAPIATCGCVEFTTDDVDIESRVNDLIEVTGDDGVKYRGFLKEVDIKYARAEAAKYKIIVKDIEP